MLNLQMTLISYEAKCRSSLGIDLNTLMTRDVSKSLTKIHFWCSVFVNFTSVCVIITVPVFNGEALLIISLPLFTVLMSELLI